MEEPEHEPEDPSDNSIEHNAKVTENRMAAQILALIEHYKQEDPVGFPGNVQSAVKCIRKLSSELLIFE